jgi:transaldolase
MKFFIDTADIAEIRAPAATGILAASARHPLHVTQCTLPGADIATTAPSVLRQLASHPLTDKGLAQFLADWQKTSQKIL